MTRKNRRVDQPTFTPMAIETEPWRLEQQAQELREIERAKFEKALDRLPVREWVVYANAKNSRAAKRPESLRLAKLLLCQMPRCGEHSIRLADRSLGICSRHAADVITWGAVVMDEYEQRMLKADVEADRIYRQERENLAAERRHQSRKNAPGWIYYIEVGNRIKIGYSTDVKRRLKQYPPDTPLLALHPGTKVTEADMHQRFIGSRAAGREWYLDTAEIRDHIKEVIEQYGEPDRARYEHRGRMHSGLRAAAPKPTGISR